MMPRHTRRWLLRTYSWTIGNLITMFVMMALIQVFLLPSCVTSKNANMLPCEGWWSTSDHNGLIAMKTHGHGCAWPRENGSLLGWLLGNLKSNEIHMIFVLIFGTNTCSMIVANLLHDQCCMGHPGSILSKGVLLNFGSKKRYHHCNIEKFLWGNMQCIDAWKHVCCLSMCMLSCQHVFCNSTNMFVPFIILL